MAEVVKKTVSDELKNKLINLAALAQYDFEVRTWVDTYIKELPTEQYLDSVKTDVAESFDFSAGNYPEGTVNPNLDGKPVLIIALRDETGNSTGYKFISLESLVDVYSGNTTTDKAIKVEVDGYTISSELLLHTKGEGEADNLAEIRADGLYIPKPAEFDATAIADRLTSVETILGHGNTAEEGQPDNSCGLVKDVADIHESITDDTKNGTVAKAIKDNRDAIGVPHIEEDTINGIAGQEATGLYAYIDNAVSNVSDSLQFASTDEIASLFAI